MRGLALVLLVGCTVSGERIPGDPDGPVIGHGSCRSDRGCMTGDLCARNNVCYRASQIRAVHALWTVGGMAANQTTCSGSTDLELEFRNPDDGDHVGYVPVPCSAGKFTVDKLPTTFTVAKLRQGDAWQTQMVDRATGDAMFDLTP